MNEKTLKQRIEKLGYIRAESYTDTIDARTGIVHRYKCSVCGKQDDLFPSSSILFLSVYEDLNIENAEQVNPLIYEMAKKHMTELHPFELSVIQHRSKKQ